MLFLQVPRNYLKIVTIIIYPGEIYQKDKQYHPTYYTRSTLHCIIHIVNPLYLQGKGGETFEKKNRKDYQEFL